MKDNMKILTYGAPTLLIIVCISLLVYIIYEVTHREKCEKNKIIDDITDPTNPQTYMLDIDPATNKPKLSADTPPIPLLKLSVGENFSKKTKTLYENYGKGGCKGCSKYNGEKYVVPSKEVKFNPYPEVIPQQENYSSYPSTKGSERFDGGYNIHTNQGVPIVDLKNRLRAQADPIRGDPVIAQTSEPIVSNSKFKYDGSAPPGLNSSFIKY